MEVVLLAKCVKKAERVKRVRDEVARELVWNEGWSYISKSEFKKLKK